MDSGENLADQTTVTLSEDEIKEHIRNLQGHGMSKRRKCKHRDTKKKVSVKARKAKRKQQRKSRRK